MNNLEGYSTNGHEYRVSQIDRNNSRRIKWMMNEARAVVKKRDEEKKQDSSNIMVDKNRTSKFYSNSTKNKKNKGNKKNMFNPSTVNKFSNKKNNFK